MNQHLVAKLYGRMLELGYEAELVGTMNRAGAEIHVQLTPEQADELVRWRLRRRQDEAFEAFCHSEARGDGPRKALAQRQLERSLGIGPGADDWAELQEAWLAVLTPEERRRYLDTPEP